MRRWCNTNLRDGVHLWADCSRAACGWAQAYYQAQRKKGKSHAGAVRCLGQCWLEVLWKMWQIKTRYDGGLHARNQEKHGSWVIQIRPARKAGSGRPVHLVRRGEVHRKQILE